MKNGTRLHYVAILLSMLLTTFFVLGCSDQNTAVVKPHNGARGGVVTNGVPPDPNARAHRGRLQIQGNDMNPETSWAWAYDYPLTKAEALTNLDILYNNLTTRQKQDRT